MRYFQFGLKHKISDDKKVVELEVEEKKIQRKI